MQVVVVQGMACMGKSTLCKELETLLCDCKWFSLDSYKEAFWDRFGFDSVEEREEQSSLAVKICFYDIHRCIEKGKYDYILIDYAFKGKLFDDLKKYLSDWNVPVKTLYLVPSNYEEHRKAWVQRSRDFSRRHPGHGASSYCNGVGDGYTNEYKDKFFSSMGCIGNTLQITVNMNPYNRDIPIEDIVSFIKE
jgi:hypothetical protein